MRNQRILLATLNAKYIHASLGLRYLLANLGSLRPQALLMEFDINQRPVEIAESILAQDPGIVGLGLYIWNVTATTELIAILKRVRPELIVVVGGPEVSHETESSQAAGLADYVIVGEGDVAFAELCRQLLAGSPPSGKLIPGGTPDLSGLALPYDEYSAEDIQHRLVYVEASRGCPFSCEFCLSSLDPRVRRFSLHALLEAMERLIARGVRHFKFVDRTFNIDLETGLRILSFFRDRMLPGMLLHFEMIPDRFPPLLRDIVRSFPAGSLQFEVGIQTWNPEVSERIQRRQDYGRTQEALTFLRQETSAHLHTDLIVGLPGENLDSFAAGFDRLVRLRPQEIQVGILKRLKGTPIARHDGPFAMVYSPAPPYEILQNRDLDFGTMQRLRRFARYWDLVSNSGNFRESSELLCRSNSPSPFQAFMAFSDWLYAKVGRQHGIALPRLAEFLFQYLTEEMGIPVRLAAESLHRDQLLAGRKELFPFLRGHVPASAGTKSEVERASHARRQGRHRDSPEKAQPGQGVDGSGVFLRPRSATPQSSKIE